MKTHKVINLNSHPDESNILYIGSSFECSDFLENAEKLSLLNKFNLQVVNLSTAEMNLYNEDKFVEDNKNTNIPINFDFMFLYPEKVKKINCAGVYGIVNREEENNHLFIFNKIEESLFENRKIHNKEVANKITKTGKKVLNELINNPLLLKNLEEAIFIKEKECVICQNCKSYFIKPIEQCSECGMKMFQYTDEYNKRYAKNLDLILNEYRNDMKTFNINETIKFIPNDKGIQIIYEFKNKWIKNPEKYTKFEYPLETILNEIDLETGQYEMQMWEFINCFGQSNSLGNGFDSPFKENNIFIHKSKFKN